MKRYEYRFNDFPTVKNVITAGGWGFPVHFSDTDIKMCRIYAYKVLDHLELRVLKDRPCKLYDAVYDA